MADTIKKIVIRIGSGLVITVIIIMGVASGLMSVLTGSSSNSSGSTTSTYAGESIINLGNYEVKTDESGAMEVLTKEQLTTAIDKCYTGELHDKLIEKRDDILSVQNNKKINASFTVAAIATEVQSGGNLDEITEDISSWISGYVDDNKTKLDDIAENKKDEAWKTSVQAELEKLYSAAGIKMRKNATGEAIVAKAAEIMQYMMDNGFAYANGNWVPKEKNISVNGKVCDCSAFVCWVLYELGYTDAQNNGWQLVTYGMDTNGTGYFPSHGWTRVNSYEELEPGDIVLMSGEGNPNGHVQIFAYRKDGVNYYINCGWDPYKHTSVYETYHKTFYSAWRAPQ